MSISSSTPTRLSVVAVFLLITVACRNGAETTTPLSAPTPTPGFAIECSPASLVTTQGCSSASCTVTSENGFSGLVSLDCSDLPTGVRCYLEPVRANVPPNGSATVGFAVSADAALGTGRQSFRVVGTSGALTSDVDATLDVDGLLAPEVRGKAMTITGCAGYVEGVVNARDLRQFRNVFVGTWRFRERGQFGEQTLSDEDGAFQLVVPRCFGEGESVFLTAGGNTCVAIPYREGTLARVDLFGRREACS